MDATLLDALWAWGIGRPAGYGVWDALRAMGYGIMGNEEWEINVLQHIKKNK